MTGLDIFLQTLSDKLNSGCQYRDLPNPIKWTVERIIDGYYCHNGDCLLMCDTCHLTISQNLYKIMDLKFKNVCEKCRGHINGVYRDRSNELSVRGSVKSATELCLDCHQNMVNLRH